MFFLLQALHSSYGHRDPSLPMGPSGPVWVLKPGDGTFGTFTFDQAEADSSQPCGTKPGTSFPYLNSEHPFSFLEVQQAQDVQAGEDKYRCASLQDVCKTGSGTDANEALNKLYQDAEEWNPFFGKWLDLLASSVNAKASKSPLKGKDRAMEKIRLKYSGRSMYGTRELTDIVRGSLVFQNGVDMCNFLAKLERHDVPANVTAGFNFAVVKSKNRFAHPADGYSDMMINVRLTRDGDEKGHLVELQLHHALMEKAKKRFHSVYKFLRGIKESLAPPISRSWDHMQRPFLVQQYLEPLRQAQEKYPDAMAELVKNTPGFDPRFNEAIDCGGGIATCKGDGYRLKETYDALMGAMREAYGQVQASAPFEDTACVKDQSLTNVPALPVSQVAERKYAQVRCI